MASKTSVHASSRSGRLGQVTICSHRNSCIIILHCPLASVKGRSGVSLGTSGPRGPRKFSRTTTLSHMDCRDLDAVIVV